MKPPEHERPSGGDCRAALEHVYEYLDKELTPVEAEALKKHFECCKRCYPVLEFCKSFQDAMERAANCQCCAPDDLKNKIKDLLKST